MPEKKNKNFGDVLKHLQLSRNNVASRSGWNGKGQFIRLQSPDNKSLMSLPYIYICTVDGDRVPWLASQTDMLAKDWVLLSH